MAQHGRVERVDSKGLLQSQMSLLLDAVTAIGSGEWVPTNFAKGGSLEVLLSGDTPTLAMALYGSNAIDQPAKSHDGTKIGSDITAGGLTAVTMQCRWMKAKVATLSGDGATVSARLHQVF